MGESYLNGALDAGRELPDLRGRLEAITAAMATLSKRRDVLKLDRKLAELVDLRRLAENLRAELAELRAATAPLLEGLGELEGVRFTAHILASQRAGQWAVLPHDIFRHQDTDVLPPDLVRADVGATFQRPRSLTLLAELRKIERQVVSLEKALQAPAAPPGRGETADQIAARIVAETEHREADRYSPARERQFPRMVDDRPDPAWLEEEERRREEDRIARGRKADAEDAAFAKAQAPKQQAATAEEAK